MIIYPAIDIRGGKCVRLTQGRYEDMTVFSDDPEAMALQFQKDGAQYIHVVDLDGARGESSNRELISRMAGRVSVPIQTGGGIRTMKDIELVLESGIARVILGTSAVQNPELVAQAALRYGNRIAVGIDARDGRVAIEGWEKTSDLKAVEFAKVMETIGVKTIIYTDIATDGMLSGPNLAAMAEMAEHVKLEVIASGGVSSIEDLLNLKKTGVQGAIVGKALYTGALNLKDAIREIAP